MDHAPILEAVESESEIQTQGDVSSLTDTNSLLLLQLFLPTTFSDHIPNYSLISIHPPCHLPFHFLVPHYHLSAWPFIPTSSSESRTLTHLCLPFLSPIFRTILRPMTIMAGRSQASLYLTLALYTYRARGLIFCTNTKLLRLKSLATNTQPISLLVNHQSSGRLPDSTKSHSVMPDTMSPST